MGRNDPYARMPEPPIPETRSEVVLVGAAAFLVVFICVGLAIDNVLLLIGGREIP